MEKETIFNSVKKSFSDLMSFKDRGDNCIEVITPFTTLNDKFISVFISVNDNGEYKISDGAWIGDGTYYAGEDEINYDNLVISSKTFYQYADFYGMQISSSLAYSGCFFYKRCNSINLIPNMVFQVAQFIASLINSRLITTLKLTEPKPLI